MNAAGLAGALIGLALGLLELALANRSLYPMLRWRYETAKLTQSHGVSPATILALIKFQSLILLPVAGYYAARGLMIIG